MKAAIFWIFLISVNDSQGRPFFKKAWSEFTKAMGYLEDQATSIPGVGHIKVGILKLAGDKDGANKAWDQVKEGIKVWDEKIDHTPGLGHIKALGLELAGEHKKGKETFNKANQAALDIAEATPVIGHGIAFGHFALGNNEKGEKLLRQANRNGLVVGGGVLGTLVGGPGGAIAGGIGGGALADSITTVEKSVQTGEDAAVGYAKVGVDVVKTILGKKDVHDIDILEAAEMVFEDGQGGLAGGKLTGAKFAGQIIKGKLKGADIN